MVREGVSAWERKEGLAGMLGYDLDYLAFKGKEKIWWNKRMLVEEKIPRTKNGIYNYGLSRLWWFLLLFGGGLHSLQPKFR